MGLYFNAGEIPAPHGEYILWCDGMGTASALTNSLRHAANFIFKLHRAFAGPVETTPDARIYPLMDGVYITVPDRNNMQTLIRSAFTALANEFVEHHDDVTRCFIVRGAVAYGASIHGENVPDNAFVHAIGTQHEQANRDAFLNSTLPATRSRLLLHSAMAAAYRAEGNAPPFGVYVHETALSAPQLVDAADRGFPARIWFWWRNNQAATQAAGQLAPAVNAYFVQCKLRSTELDYPAASIDKHAAGLAEYFREFLN